MKQIKIYNRDGAHLWLEYLGPCYSEEKASFWQLKVDDKHKYCLEYMRRIGELTHIEAVDPSGGPFLSLGFVFNNEYKIIQILNTTLFILKKL